MIRTKNFGIRQENIKKQLNILIQLAKFDGNYDQKERSFISEFGKKYSLCRNEIEEIERNPDYHVDIRSFNMDEKVELLYNVVFLAKVDQRILPSEIIYCQEIASKLGFRKSVIDAMLPLVNSQPLELVNYTTIRRKIAPYI